MDKKKNTKEELKKEIEILDDKIVEEKAKLKKISAAHDTLLSLKSNLDVCTEIFSKSLDEASKSRFNNLISDNDVSFKKTCTDFLNQTDFIKNNINKLNSEHDMVLHEYDSVSRNDTEDKPKKDDKEEK